MEKQSEIDPSSPYYRECPYCEEAFMAKHMLQKFCPEKYEVSNFCKNRYKTLCKHSIISLGGPESKCNEALNDNKPVEVNNDSQPKIASSDEEMMTNTKLKVLDDPSAVTQKEEKSINHSNPVNEKEVLNKSKASPFEFLENFDLYF